MFETTDIHALLGLLNSYPLPMFAAQRPTPKHAFRLLCINAEHERASGLVSAEIEGLRPLDLLPPGEAERVERRYAHCANTKRTIWYEETLRLSTGPQRWRTALFRIPMPGQIQRIVGSAIVLPSHPTPSTSAKAVRWAHVAQTLAPANTAAPNEHCLPADGKVDMDHNALSARRR